LARDGRSQDNVLHPQPLPVCFGFGPVISLDCNHPEEVHRTDTCGQSGGSVLKEKLAKTCVCRRQPRGKNTIFMLEKKEIEFLL